MNPADFEAEQIACLPPEAELVTFAKDQPQYRPLPVARLPGYRGVLISRWTLTPEERAAIAAGEDLYIQHLTFNNPLQPLLPTVGLPELCPMDTQMALFPRLTAPLRGAWLLRRLLAEVRGMRRALERQADAMELAAQDRRGDAASLPGQTFRSYTRLKEQLSERDLQGVTGISYAEADLLAVAGAKEEELRHLLGRDPSPDEIMRAVEGDIL